MAMTPQQLLRAELADLQAYHVADAQGLVKLDAMENPYGLPQTLQAKWVDVLKHVSLNRYPDPHATQLKNTIRSVFNVSSNLDIIFGNGSDELIQLMVMAVAKPNTSVLTVTPSFSMYKIISQFVGVQVIEVPLQLESFSLQTDLMLKKIEQDNPALIFLACPNNPTGTLWPSADVEKIIQASNGLVIIDEAYAPFASYSLMSLVEKYSHALLLRTVSKMGLAGLRLGWLAGASEWLDEFDKLRLPYNINILTQASVQFALENKTTFDEQAKQICDQREHLNEELKKLDNIQVYESEANFILLKLLKHSSNEVFNSLLSKKILIKNVSDNDMLKNCLRVTIGTEEENQKFLAELTAAIN